jgi:prepilin peptidase CpaA
MKFTDLALILLLGGAVYFDMKSRKIPNKITMPAVLVGIVWYSVSSGLNGFLYSISGFSLGLAVFLLPFMMGGMGAGDVKLLAAIGALMGWRFIFSSVLVAAIAGGFLAVLYLSYKKGLVKMFVGVFGVVARPLLKTAYMTSGKLFLLNWFQFFDEKVNRIDDVYIPYAVPIAIGSLYILMQDVMI